MISRLLLEQSVDKQRRIYRRLYERHGNSHRALHWTSPHTQRRRFEVLTQIAPMAGKEVLDLGCGLADMLVYLIEEEIACCYTGYDVVPEFVRDAKRRFPGIRFEERNILLRPPAQRFDFVLASGLFAFGSRLFLSEMVRAAYAMCNHAFAFNLHLPMSTDSRFLQIEPYDVEMICHKLSPLRLEIRRDYLENDITFILYKK